MRAHPCPYNTPSLLPAMVNILNKRLVSCTPNWPYNYGINRRPSLVGRTNLNWTTYSETYLFLFLLYVFSNCSYGYSNYFKMLPLENSDSWTIIHFYNCFSFLAYIFTKKKKFDSIYTNNRMKICSHLYLFKIYN